MGSSRSRRDIRSPRERVLPGSWIVPTACGPVEYGTYGVGSPVLAVPGFTGGDDQGVPPARGLALEGFRLIAPSREPGASPEAEADTWANFLDALRITRVPVIAFSAGAAPAVQLAVRHPDRISALVLMVPGGGGLAATPTVAPAHCACNAGDRFQSPVWVLMRMAPRGMYAVVGVPASQVPSLPPRERARLEETMRNVLPPSQQVSTPTLLVNASDDLYRTLPVARHAPALVLGAKLMDLEAGGHLLLGRGHEVWPSVAAFIERAAGSPQKFQ